MKTILALLCAVGLVQGFHVGPLHPKLAFMEDLRSKGDSRIIAGKPAVNGQFPHQAFLLLYKSNGVYGCGGSLIGNHTVLTAAHCLDQTQSLTVHLGDVKYADSPIKLSSTQLKKHERYNNFNLNNDIGLITLPSAVQETENIKIIPYNKDTSVTYLDRNATVSGFGLTSNTGTISPILNYVGVKVISNSKCGETYGEIIIDSTICTVGGETPQQGACNSDSGGPLIVEENGKHLLIGAVSFGHRAGCDSHHPNAFVRTSHFTQWISDNM